MKLSGKTRIDVSAFILLAADSYFEIVLAWSCYFGMSRPEYNAIDDSGIHAHAKSLDTSGSQTPPKRYC